MEDYARTDKSTGLPSETLSGHIDMCLSHFEKMSGQLVTGTERDWVRALISNHDIGKAVPDWQDYLRGGSGSTRPDHMWGGAILSGRQRDTWGLPTAVVFGHHGMIPSHEEIQDRLNSQSHPLDRVEPYYRKYPSSAKLMGAIEARFPVDVWEQVRDWVPMIWSRLALSSLVDCDRLAAEEHDNGRARSYSYDSVTVLKDKLLRHHEAEFGKPTDELGRVRQKLWEDAGRDALSSHDLFAMTSATSTAKTMAYLRFAIEHAVLNGLDRVIIVLPYCSIISQVSEVAREIFGDHNTLEHQSNYELRGDMKSAAENWDAPVVITSNVQFFESVFSRNPTRLRKVHNVSKAMIVLDEPQSTPTGLVKPIVRILHIIRHMFRSHILLATATMPGFDKTKDRPWGLEGMQEICSNPQETHEKMKRVDYDWKEIGHTTTKELAEFVSKEDQFVLICNVRLGARRVSEHLSHMGVECFHLSALNAPKERAEIIKEVKRRFEAGEPALLVSTQVVEAGVDFRRVTRGARQKCSIVQFLQAGGRLGRDLMPGHVGAKCYLFSLSDVADSETFINEYGITKDAMAANNLDFGMWSLDTVRDYFDRLYRNCDGKEKDDLDAYGLCQKKTMSACRGDVHFHHDCFDEFKFIEGRCSVVVPYEPEAVLVVDEIRSNLAAGKYVRRGLLRKLQPYTITLYSKEYDELFSSGVLEDMEGVWVLKREHVSEWYKKGGSGLQVSLEKAVKA